MSISISVFSPLEGGRGLLEQTGRQDWYLVWLVTLTCISHTNLVLVTWDPTRNQCRSVSVSQSQYLKRHRFSVDFHIGTLIETLPNNPLVRPLWIFLRCWWCWMLQQSLTWRYFLPKFLSLFCWLLVTGESPDEYCSSIKSANIPWIFGGQGGPVISLGRSPGLNNYQHPTLQLTCSNYSVSPATADITQVSLRATKPGPVIYNGLSEVRGYK